MKKFVIGTFALFIMIGSAIAGGNYIDDCYNCRVTYVTKKVKTVKVIKQYVPVTPAVPAPIATPQPVAPVVPIMPIPYVSGPTRSPYYPPPVGYAQPGPPPQPVAQPAFPVYSAPVSQPVPPPQRGCTWYVDPYDLFGQLFGDPDLVQACWSF